MHMPPRLLGFAALLASIVAVAPPALHAQGENGDVNADSRIELSDAVYLLAWLFLSGPAPVDLPCAVAFDCVGETVVLSNGDSNGDGERDISDAVYLLNWLFGGGAPPEPICFCTAFPPCASPCPEPYLCVPSGPAASTCTGDLATCEDVIALYEVLAGGLGAPCGLAESCHVLFGHCGVGIGGCYYAASRAIRQEHLDALAARFQELGCTGPVCRCAPPPEGAICSEGECRLE